jgi:quercetin dioxygenase-like cupin family protein
MESAKTHVDKDLLPEEIRSLPKVEIPYDGVTGYCLKNDEKQLVFFVIEEGVSVPNHAHCAQRGTVVTGEVTIEIEGHPELYQAGDVYHIPEGARHRAIFSKRTFLIDLFDAPDRYPVVA